MSNYLPGPLQGYSAYDAAQYLLSETGVSNIYHTLLAGTIGVTLQAFITGSLLQLVHRYFVRQARVAHSVYGQHAQDPPLARAGVVWLTSLICLHVVVVNIINARVVLMSAQFTAGYLMDFWLAQISNLIFAIVLLPVFVFFAFRVWNLWSRRRSIMALCLVSVLPAVGLGVTAAALGLQHPYPLQAIDNSAFAAWLPFVTMTINKLQWISLASSIAQFATACVFSALICLGLFHHRQCCSVMPGIMGKVAFVFGESLFPLVGTSGAILAADVLIKTSNNPIGPLISRAVHSCAPAIYFHCLMNSLTSAHRHRDAMRSAVEQLAEDGMKHDGEKGDPYASEAGSKMFDPSAHPEDLDTPLQIQILDHAHKPAKKGGLPSIITSTASASTSSGAPLTTPLPSPMSFMVKRPSFSFRPSFRSHGHKHLSKDQMLSPSASESGTDEALRSAGSGRRSSLAAAARSPSDKSSGVGGLSIKLQNKLPVVSYKPNAVGRRESESIFVAHEEFEGLPTTPGDADVGLRLGLGDIAESDSNASTPRFHTPNKIDTPLRSPSPLPVPGARSPARTPSPAGPETTAWAQSPTRSASDGANDQGMSPKTEHHVPTSV